MSAQPTKLIEEALRLPPEARAALADALLQSLDEEPDPDAESQWAAEIARRLDAVDEGRVKPVGWTEARKAIFERPRA